MSSVIPAQYVDNHAKRMSTRVLRLNAALGRHIRKSSYPTLTERVDTSLPNWRQLLRRIIFDSHLVIMRDAMGLTRSIIAGNRKNAELDYLLDTLRPELAEYTTRQVNLIHDYLRNRFYREIAKTNDERLAMDAIINILANEKYAERIARTEALTATERGSFEAADSLGVRMVKTWISREDAKVRRAHAAAHGQQREISSPFDVGGEALMYPGDASASARNRVNCRCTAQYTFP